MRDLIDRRPLFDIPIFYNPDNEEYDDFRKGWNACNKAWLKCIRELPTAYNVDKVVEQLEELAKEHPYKVIGKPETYSEYNEGWGDCTDRAIEIMERGGADDNSKRSL